MDWLFGKKKEEKKEDSYVVQIKIDKSSLQKLKPIEGMKLPKKPKMKTMQDI